MTRKTLSIALIAATVGVLLTLAVLWGGGWLGSDAPSVAPAAIPDTSPRVVQLDAAAMAADAIAFAPLHAATTRVSTNAVATVVDLSPLADLVSAATSAAAQFQAAQARSAASGAVYVRDKALYADNQNISLAELQSAQATATADHAATAAARAALTNARFALRQQFGPVIGRWPLDAIGKALEQRRDVLVQVSTSAETGPPPQQVRLTLPSGRTITAQYVSPAVRTDPRIQGASFLYVVPAEPSLLAGATVSAALPQGPALSGVLVPADAVVVWQGASWAYQQTAPGRFRRVSVSTQVPVDGGYLDTRLAAGSRLVTRGAQLLLSQEMQPPPSAVSAGGDDDDD
ncbi:MAG: hypothetical protein ACTHM8_09730 [Sphingomonas sp.]